MYVLSISSVWHRQRQGGCSPVAPKDETTTATTKVTRRWLRPLIALLAICGSLSFAGSMKPEPEPKMALISTAAVVPQRDLSNPVTRLPGNGDQPVLSPEL